MSVVEGGTGAGTEPRAPVSVLERPRVRYRGTGRRSRTVAAVQ
ncbi:hypothetical protein [Streptomyces sp. NPDC087512]